jgi:hypothetical protein
MIDLQWKDDVKLYEIIKNAARKCKLSEGTIKMLLFSLSLRVYSPRVEAGRNEALPFPEKCVDQVRIIFVWRQKILYPGFKQKKFKNTK